MNEYISKSFSDKFDSQKLGHDLLSDIRYPYDINYAVMDPTNINGQVELRYVQNISSASRDTLDTPDPVSQPSLS
jgi:hypothetical protein